MRLVCLDLQLGCNLITGCQLHMLFLQVGLKFCLGVRQWSAILLVVVSKCLMPSPNIIEMDGGDVEGVAFQHLAIDGNCVALPKYIVGNGFYGIL